MIKFGKYMDIIKIPTFADAHVHLREPGNTYKEDFSSGTKAAVAGGYTQILDMPNNTPPTISPHGLEEKINLTSGRIWCDVGFNFGASLSSIKYFPKIKNRVFALKVYMNQTTGTLLIKSREDRDEIFKNWNNPKPIMVHAEGETVESAIALAKRYSRKLHVCHVSFDQISTIKKAKMSGLSISCEVCPHHLFLTRDDVPKLKNFGVMKPPLLPRKDVEKLWEVMDQIDMISTDHAPHTVEDKLDQASPKFGVPGLETTLPLMLWAVEKRMISLQRVIEMLSTSPRKIFQLPGQPDTYIEVDLSKKYIIGKLKLFTKCQWTPFKDKEGRGKIIKVVLRGQTIFENGFFKGEPNGKVIYPAL